MTTSAFSPPKGDMGFIDMLGRCEQPVKSPPGTKEESLPHLPCDYGLTEGDEGGQNSYYIQPLPRRHLRATCKIPEDYTTGQRPWCPRFLLNTLCVDDNLNWTTHEEEGGRSMRSREPFTSGLITTR
uniref:Uncharacterized protein n=1 Tax=Corethron hystrix TaxID=216773 RepID=A0A7S1FT85_9STRA|mmetsp:Transcript_27098/g.62304  ORF Transcript_27098/g.62304 Transcript_27098/m.62304 type:complete len:127 (+) Transcript_27098:175-555(+)